MKPRRRLRTRLLLSNLAVIAVVAVVLFVAVGLVAPGAFDSAMGHAMAGMDGMMTDLVRAAFGEAVQTAIVIAVAVAVLAAVVVSAALSTRISRPVGSLAQASRRIASGRYAERVPVTSDDEIGELAESFNTMAASLEATERRRLELVGDVAHELRTPLTTLDGYLEGFEDGIMRPDAASWRLLRGETSRLSRLVSDLQELWRAEARQLVLSPIAVDVAAELQAGIDRLAAQAQEHEVRLELGIVPATLAVRADPDRLRQIIDNFTTNAIRHAPPASTVTLSARGEGEAVTFGVADQGPGLTGDEPTRVFERFYRIDPSRSRALGGSGIGLAIARALAEAMDGRVWAESDGPGRGSTFYVSLPAAR